MGEGKLTPLTTPTPLNRQSRNIAHVITSTISPHKPHSVKIAPGVTCPHIAKVTTHFFISSLYEKSFQGPRAQAVEPILSRDTSTDAYSRRVGLVPFGVRRQYFHIFTLKAPKNPIFGHMVIKPMENTYSRSLTLSSTLSTHKSFSVRGTAGGY